MERTGPSGFLFMLVLVPNHTLPGGPSPITLYFTNFKSQAHFTCFFFYDSALFSSFFLITQDSHNFFLQNNCLHLLSSM